MEKLTRAFFLNGIWAFLLSVFPFEGGGRGRGGSPCLLRWFFPFFPAVIVKSERAGGGGGTSVTSPFWLGLLGEGRGRQGGGGGREEGGSRGDGGLQLGAREPGPGSGI